MEIIYKPSEIENIVAPLRRIYVLHGCDDLQKDELILEFKKRFVDEAYSDFDCEVADADTSGVEQILSSAGQLPFASQVRMTIVRGAESFRKRERSADADRLSKGMAKLGTGACLVLRVAASEEERSRGKTVLTAGLDAAVREHGLFVRCNVFTEDALIGWAQTYVKEKAGVRLEEEAAMALIKSSRDDRIALRNEIEKVICLSGGDRSITVSMVEAVCTRDPEDVMFKLVDAVGKREINQALTFFNEMMRYDTKVHALSGKLLALLSRQIRLLAQAAELSEMGIQPTNIRQLSAEVTAKMPSDGSILSMSWKARELFTMSRKWKAGELAHGAKLLVDCDLANKGAGEGANDVASNLRMTIIGLCTGLPVHSKI